MRVWLVMGLRDSKLDLASHPQKTAEPGQPDYLRGNQLAVLVLAGGPAAAPFHQPSAGWSCFLQR